MSDLLESLLEDGEKTSKQQGIDIEDFNTVSYGTKGLTPKRRLSLNIYKYEKTLGGDESSFKASKATPDARRQSVFSRESPPKKTMFMSTFGLVVSVCCFVMLAAVVFVVLANGRKGNSSICI